jgi:CBS domain-containing protein
MEEKLVKNLMIPIEDYAVVSEATSIGDALRVMSDTSEKLSVEKYKHQAIQVQDAKGNIVGRLTQADILKGLEPKYKDIGGSSLSPAMRERLADMMTMLPDKTFIQRCKAQRQKPVKEFMTTVDLSIDENESISHALHIMLISGHRSLLVTREGKKPVGVLRLTDIFLLVRDAIVEA